MVVEFSLDGGSNWQTADTIDSQANKVWTTINVDLPTGIDTNPPPEVSFELIREGAISGTTTVDWEVIGMETDANDFIGGSLPSGQVTFGPGESTAQIAIQVNADVLTETDELFEIRLTETSGDGLVTLSNTDTATGVILNDDASYIINANSQFRWRQLDSSGGDFDNWGIDNIGLTSGAFGDDFDPDIDFGEWQEISSGTAESDFAGSDGNALYFAGDADRFAVLASRPLRLGTCFPSTLSTAATTMAVKILRTAKRSF